MKELFKRSITGILYVFLLLAAAMLNTEAFNFLFLVFGLVCLYEFKKIIKLSGYYIFLAFLGLWWLFIYLIEDFHQKKSLALLLLAATLLTNLFLLSELFGKKATKYSNAGRFAISLFYIGTGCIFLTMIPYYEYHFAKFLIIGIFILIWVNDSFAFLVGKTLGKNKLFPSVSPKKTIEGFAGGLVFALIAAFVLSRYHKDLYIWQWFILAVVVVLTGTLGDLIESKFKRMAGVKDSGAILPGHGGLLDRLDSLVFAAPFAYLTLQIFSYVS
ncbi:phosphatidate cytidylyltransferase [Flavobacteriaceae bacterium M23B6Z8]